MRREGIRVAQSALILAAALSTPAVLVAQPTAPRIPSCLDSIPLTAMRRVPVYAAAEIAEVDPVSAAVIASMDLLTQALAEQARALLGAAAGQLPPGEPIITWRQL